jgi:hypothetical protein
MSIVGSEIPRLSSYFDRLHAGLSVGKSNQAGLSIGQRKKIGQSFFARLIRVNYLAADIQIAIIDGTQAPGLTRHKILYSSLPLEWEQQQRQLMGFG